MDEKKKKAGTVRKIEDLTPEQREEVERIFSTLEKPAYPKKPEIDLREKFVAQGQIRAGTPAKPVTLLIRSVGKEGMMVEAREKGARLARGGVINVDGIKLKITNPDKKGRAALILDA